VTPARDRYGRFIKATPPPPAILPRRHAVPPISWPLQRHDITALILTVCAMALAWLYHKIILLVVAVYYLFRGWLYLCRRHPMVA
jgi:hypothetical protein